jgi:hypothetical protein
MLSLLCNAGPARGQGRGSFADSVITAANRFYTEVVQHIKPWAPAPPKVLDNEPAGLDAPLPGGELPTGDNDRYPEDVADTLLAETL